MNSNGSTPITSQRNKGVTDVCFQNPRQETRPQREIEATDRQIDQLVYELYGLTDQEIKIVEEAT
jgi:hypothetical protein